MQRRSFFPVGDGFTFRCNARGELGDGYRISHNYIYGEGQYDFHLECFALQGEKDYSSHSHPYSLFPCQNNLYRLYLLHLFAIFVALKLIQNYGYTVASNATLLLI